MYGLWVDTRFMGKCDFLSILILKRFCLIIPSHLGDQIHVRPADIEIIIRAVEVGNRHSPIDEAGTAIFQLEKRELDHLFCCVFDPGMIYFMVK